MQPDKLNIVSEDNKENLPWYKNGLPFKCTGCGKCCTGAPGYIWVSNDEIEEIANFLNISLKDFYNRYLRQVGNKFSLLEDFKSYDCIFLKDKKCDIYSVRPKQCRTYPWWPTNLKTESDWKAAAEYCEGINPEAPIVPLSTIHEQLSIQEEKQ